MSVYLSIIVPLYNEEESVGKLISEILEVAEQFDFSYEIILVDDGCTDKTWEIIEQLKDSTPQLIGIKFRRNYGQTSAMFAGFDYAKGKVIVSLDGDLQNDPKDIPQLLNKLSKGYDVVCGWRKNRQDKTLTRILPSKIANWLIGKVTGVAIHDNGCSLKAYRSSVIKSISLYSDMHRFIPAITTLVGARITEIVVNHRPRKYGEAKYGLSRIWKVLFDLISIKMLIQFHHNPIVWFSIVASIFLLLGLIIGILSVLDYFIGNQSIVLSTASFLFLSLFASLLFWGLLAEYFINIERTQKDTTNSMN